MYLDELGKYLKGSRDTTTVKSEESSGDEEGKGKTRDLSDYNVYFADSGTDNSLSGPIFLFEDGSAMAITDYTGSVIDFEDTSKGSYKGCIAGIVFDINGFENKPNKWGKDVFQFDLDDNGSILPFGGKAEELAYGEKPIWESDCSEDKLELGRTCSGSVFDNNGKVIYKY